MNETRRKKADSLLAIALERGFIDAQKHSMILSSIEAMLEMFKDEKPEKVAIQMMTKKKWISNSEAQLLLSEFYFLNEQALRSNPTTELYPQEVKDRINEASARLGKYVLLNKIAQGGMGSVWHAYDTELMRHVAIKLLTLSSEEDIARFRREAVAQAQIQHPNVVEIYDVGENSGVHYISMQYIEGSPVDERKMDLNDVLRIILDAAMALDFAHRKGIVHRDIKPGNILVDKEGHVYLSDFGLAKFSSIKDTVTEANTVVGTPAYMSPEQVRGGEVDGRSDVYSLGVTLYELLTGVKPFSGEDPVEIAVNVLKADVRPPRLINPGIPIDLQMVIMKCMIRDRDQRYKTAADLAHDLERILAGKPLEDTKIEREGFGKFLSTNYKPVVAISVAIVSFIAALILLVYTLSSMNKTADIIVRNATVHIEMSAQLWNAQPDRAKQELQIAENFCEELESVTPRTARIEVCMHKVELLRRKRDGKDYKAIVIKLNDIAQKEKGLKSDIEAFLSRVD